MAHVLACSRVKVTTCPAQLPVKWIEALEQNQLLNLCCRHVENHEIEAFYSNEDEKFRGGRENPPDVYIFYCSCGRLHRRFMVGGGQRPVWEIR